MKAVHPTQGCMHRVVRRFIWGEHAATSDKLSISVASDEGNEGKLRTDGGAAMAGQGRLAPGRQAFGKGVDRRLALYAGYAREAFLLRLPLCRQVG